MGTKPIVHCELSLKTLKAFDSSVSKLLDLSDLPAWHPLRAAIRKLDQAGALKSCAVLAAFFAIMAKVTNEGVLRKAKSYETAWEYGADRIKKARAEMTNLERKIEEAEPRRPEVFATARFTDYKTALCDLVVCGLTALDQLYEIEGLATSPKTLEVVHKTGLRKGIDEMLKSPGTAEGARYWGKLQDLLDGVEEIVRRPNPSEWKREPPVSFDSNGNSLRADVRKMTASDEALVKQYLNTLSPGMHDKIENASDQVGVLLELMNTQHPPFPPTLAYVKDIALIHVDDLKDLRAKHIKDDR
jgi:hypothetical protein